MKMKTSNKILLTVAVVIAAGTVVSVLLARVAIDRAVASTGIEKGEASASDGGRYVAEEYEFEDFKELRFTGGWKAEVRRGGEYAVKLRVPERYHASLDVKKRGAKLQLGLNREYELSGKALEAELVMPELEYVESIGGIDLRLEGFSGEKLSLDLSGGSSVKAAGGGYKQVVLQLKGGSDVNLLELPAEHARVEAVGASDVKLAMRGGDLTGSLSGVGTIEYTGELRRQEVATSGVTSVSRLE